MTKEATSRTIFGFWIFLMSDCILFGVLFATYVVLRTGSENFPWNLSLALAQTLLLLTASFVFGLAHQAAKNRKKIGMWVGMGATLLLGAAFMILELLDLSRLVAEGHGWQASGFLSAYFNLVGTHGIHLAIGLLWTAVLMVQIGWRRRVTPVILKRLTCLRLFWYFLNLVWLFIFTFVDLVGVA